ncbi:DUF6894 family protein [Methylobacterium brachythecii]|uniref:DUF6894 domain-containing protein n=1 Tax=Methylobacterium brachythecii TaxID=1176177 RepID=A0A7W6AI20_9HYPH|nr:hypothetical protein [Methylobacterium brachythecii]MBB3901351.1 hypothetical protein [Methylobacterium brachythecii]GLS42926.1 hypothetical protein GCM10007884_09110 [Methylobacterium brachythecii]
MDYFFFDIHDGIHVTDSVGQRLPDLEAAKMEAVRIAGAFAMRPSMMGSSGGAVVVVIRNTANSIVMTVRMAFNIDAPENLRKP